MNAFWFALNAACAALNVGLFAAYGDPLSLAAAIFCGLFAIFHLALMVSE